jgi:hypothetical protein
MSQTLILEKLTQVWFIIFQNQTLIQILNLQNISKNLTFKVKVKFGNLGSVLIPSEKPIPVGNIQFFLY